MVPPRRLIGSATFAALSVVAAGCYTLIDTTEATPESLLRAARPSPDAVTIDIYWADVSQNASDTTDLWRFVQEERLDPSLRRRLADHGLRAGVVGGTPPTEVVRLLNPAGEREADAGAVAESTGVVRKTIQIRPGDPLEIKASETLEAAPLLAADGRSAEVLRGAQAFYSLSVLRGAAGGYTVELTPELQSGEARWRWTPDDTGMIARQKPLREKRVFADLRVATPLVVGEMLIVTARPEASEGLLGGYLHRDAGESGADRRAILVRLTHTPPSPAFEYAAGDATD